MTSNSRLSLDQIATQVLISNLAINSSDKVLIVTDEKMLPEANLWQMNAKRLAHNVKVCLLDNMTENAQEPPPSILNQMLRASVVLLQTTYSLSHTAARQQASQNGARIASLPTVNLPMIERTLSADYLKIAQLSRQLEPLLTNADHARITSTNGTNIILSLHQRRAIADTGFYTNPGDFGNLPAGETFIAPVEGSAEGTVVVDGSFAGLEMDQPIKLTIKLGKVISINGGKAARALIKQIESISENARNIAELGIGTNPTANPRGRLIEAEKAYGTIHIALGNNATIGGTVSVPFHSDGVLLSPTLHLDDQIVLDRGAFLI